MPRALLTLAFTVDLDDENGLGQLVSAMDEGAVNSLRAVLEEYGIQPEQLEDRMHYYGATLTLARSWQEIL